MVPWLFSNHRVSNRVAVTDISDLCLFKGGRGRKQEIRAANLRTGSPDRAGQGRPQQTSEPEHGQIEAQGSAQAKWPSVTAFCSFLGSGRCAGPRGSITCPSRHVQTSGYQYPVRSSETRLPAGGSSFSRLFSGLQISRCLFPALTLQLFLPSRQGRLPGEKEMLEGPRTGKQEKKVEWLSGPSVDLGVSADKGTVEEEAGGLLMWSLGPSVKAPVMGMSGVLQISGADTVAGTSSWFGP